MSDTSMDRHWRRGVLLQTLMFLTLIGLSLAGNRPFSRGERPRYPRHHDRGTQRIQYPSLNDRGAQQIQYPTVNDQGTQRVVYPSLHERGQTIQYPSLNDIGAGSQIQVKLWRWFLLLQESYFSLSTGWQGSVKKVRDSYLWSKGHAALVTINYSKYSAVHGFHARFPYRLRWYDEIQPKIES